MHPKLQSISKTPQNRQMGIHSNTKSTSKFKQTQKQKQVTKNWVSTEHWQGLFVKPKSEILGAHLDANAAAKNTTIKAAKAHLHVLLLLMGLSSSPPSALIPIVKRRWKTTTLGQSQNHQNLIHTMKGREFYFELTIWAGTWCRRQDTQNVLTASARKTYETPKPRIKRPTQSSGLRPQQSRMRWGNER